LSDEQICQAVQTGLQASPATASLHVGVDVMNHRVFLEGHIDDSGKLHLIEDAVAEVPGVGEVVDLLDVE
jgi:osmotically-inducible protein OsmY